MGATEYSIYTKFKAKDGVTPTFNAITKRAGMTSTVFRKLSLTTREVGSCFSQTMKQARFLMNSFVAFFAIGYIKDFYSKVTEAAKVQLTAEQKLTTALKNNAAIRAKGNDAYLKSTRDLLAYASNIQQKGLLGDEVIIGGMQTLGSMGFDDSIIKKIIPSIADLVVQQKGYNATVSDFEAASKGIGRALAGAAAGVKRTVFYTVCRAVGTICSAG